MIYRANAAQQAWFIHSGNPRFRRGFSIDQDAFLKFLEEAQYAHKEYSWDEKVAWAAYSAYTHPNFRHGWLRRVLSMLIPLLLIAVSLQAQESRASYARMQVRDGTGAWVDVTSVAGLPIICLSGCGGIAAFLDSAPFVASLTPISITGGVFNDGLSTLTSGMAAAPRITSARGLQINIRNNAGTEIGTSGAPLRIDPTGTTTQPVSGTFFQATQPVSLTTLPALTAGSAVIGHVIVDTAPTTAVTGTFFQATQPVSIATWAGGTLGAMANYGTSPGAVLVPGVNASITNTPAVTLASTTITSEVPGTAATNLGKAEDAASASGDTGVFALAVRKDTNATLTSADGDYVQVSADNYGVVSVSHRHPNAIRCTVTVSTATALTAVGGSCVAPGAGLSIYVTDVLVSADVASAIAADAFPTLKYGTGGTCGTGTTVWWGAMNAVKTPVFSSFSTPIKIPANNELCWIDSTAASKFWVISGFIAP